MAAKTINLEFDGYWRDENKSGLPDKSGIYVVYTCVYNPPRQGEKKGSVALKKLVYIGEAENVNGRVNGKHECRKDWERHIKAGEILCFSFAPVASADRERAEAALIYKHQPPVNVQCKDKFNYDDTTINTSGNNHDISTTFTVKRSK